MLNDKVIDQAVILAGGLGTRLGSITKKIPKPLIKLNNKPFIEYLLFNLSRQGFRRVLILCSYKASLFFKKYHNKKYLNLKIFCVKEKYLAGTGGALLNAKNLLDKNFLLCNGDTYLDVNINNFCFRFNSKKMLALIISSFSKIHNRYTKIKIAKNGLVKKFGIVNKRNNFYFNTGYYICSKNILRFIKKKCSLENDIFPKIVKKKKLYASTFNDYHNRFIDIGTLDDLKKAKKFLKNIIKKPAVFFDRDGVINKDLGYVFKKVDIVWKKDIFRFIKYYNDNRYYIFVITNQSGIGRGFYTEKQLFELHNWMNNKLRSKGAFIDKFYYSPYFKDSLNLKYRKGFRFRKPNIGMLNSAFKEWNIDLKKSKFYGDSEVDRITAKRKNLKFKLVKFEKELNY
jgi:D,D-heptose 1,7-bisphosphate phosphatase